MILVNGDIMLRKLLFQIELFFLLLLQLLFFPSFNLYILNLGIFFKKRIHCSNSKNTILEHNSTAACHIV